MRTFLRVNGLGTSGGILVRQCRYIPTLLLLALCTKYIGNLSGPGGKTLASVHIQAAQADGEELDHEDSGTAYNERRTVTGRLLCRILVLSGVLVSAGLLPLQRSGRLSRRLLLSVARPRRRLGPACCQGQSVSIGRSPMTRCREWRLNGNRIAAR
jgi:hypothetical protein